MEALDENERRQTEPLKMTQWQCILRDISKFTHLAHPTPFIPSIHRLSEYVAHRRRRLLLLLLLFRYYFFHFLFLIGMNASTSLCGYFHAISFALDQMKAAHGPARRHLYRATVHRIPFQSNEMKLNSNKQTKKKCAP